MSTLKFQNGFSIVVSPEKTGEKRGLNIGNLVCIPRNEKAEYLINARGAGKLNRFLNGIKKIEIAQGSTLSIIVKDTETANLVEKNLPENIGMSLHAFSNKKYIECRCYNKESNEFPCQ